MFKVAVVGGKGGTSKTTVARAIAVKCRSHGLTVAGFDLDGEQASFARWNERRRELGVDTFPVVIEENISMLKRRIDSYAFDIGVIDGGAYVSKDTVEIAKFCDMLVIPTGYSLDDMAPLVRIVEKLVVRGLDRRKVCVVFAKVSDSKKLRDEAREFLESNGLFVAEHYIPYGDAYFKAMDQGYALTEVKNAPRLFTQARYVMDSIMDRAVYLQRLE